MVLWKKDDLKILNRVYNSWPTDGIGISVNTVVILHWKYKTKNMVALWHHRFEKITSPRHDVYTEYTSPNMEQMLCLAVSGVVYHKVFCLFK